MNTATTREEWKHQAAARTEHRRLGRERLAALRAKLKAAIAARNAKMKEITSACRDQRRAVREQVKTLWTEGRRAIRDRAEAERRRARAACAAEKARARETCDSAIALARAELAAEKRRAAEEGRIRRDERAGHAALKRSHDTGAAHALVRAAMLGALGPLYERVRPTPGQSRPESILHYAETHPDQVHALLHPAADRTIAETKAEIAAVERTLGAPTTTDLDRAHRSRKRRASKASPAASVRKKGELARRGGGMLLEDLLRERDELKAEKGIKKGGLRLVPREGIAANETATSATRTTYEPLLSPGAVERERLRKLAERPEPNVKAPELRDTAQIALRIREDIKVAVKTKELPKATYSVRTSKYSMGSSITVEASKLPFPVMNVEAFVVESPGASYVTFDSAHFRSRFTPEARGVEAKLNAIVDAYHWDRSDPMTDYSNVRFHKDVRLLESKAAWSRMEAEKIAAARTAP